MVVLGLVITVQLVSASLASCPPGVAARLEDAAARVEVLDLRGAASLLQGAASRGCSDAVVGAAYLSGLVAAEAAWRQGGTEASIVPVRASASRLAMHANGMPGAAEIARLVLMASVAAAQNERDEMAIWLSQATQMEMLQRAAGQPGAPYVSAAEAAGDLWLRLYRYTDAQVAYRFAATTVGNTARVLAGLGRSAAGLQDRASACGSYRDLIASWGQRNERPAEVVAAREYLSKTRCGGGDAR